MFREMRRKRQQLSREEAEAILGREPPGSWRWPETTVYPYAVPLSYVYQDGKLGFTVPRGDTSWTPSGGRRSLLLRD